MSFNFGGTPGAAAAPKPAFGGFGAPPASAPATTVAGGAGFAFGATPPAGAAKPTPTLSSGLSFGAGQPSAFSTPAAASVAPTGFGAAAATPAASGFGGFGAAAAPAAATSAATPGFGGFGAAAATASKPASLSFGATTTTTSAAGFGGLGAGQPAAKPAGFGGFGGGATSTGFGQPASSAAGGGGAFGGLGATATSSAPSAFGGFGATAAAPAATGGFGGFGAAPATSTVGLGGQTASIAKTSTTTVTSTGGLGGSALSGTVPFGVPSSSFQASGQAGQPGAPGAVQAGGGNRPGGGKDDSWKDGQIPPELAQDVEAFRKFVKDQKGLCTDMSHLSLPKLHQKIQSDVDGLNAVVNQLGSGVAKQKAQLERLKKDCAKELVNVEVAQRTKDTPPALQYENNNGPIEYFHRLLVNFENQMVLYKRQIADVENYLQTMSGDSASSSSTPETLIKAMQKTHAAFVSLAGRYQPLHEAIQQQKSIYVQQYRQKHATTDNPFSKKDGGGGSGSARGKLHSSDIGPSPFTGKPDPLSLAKAAAQQLAAAAAAAAGGQPNSQVTQGGGPPALGLGASGSFGFSGGPSASGFGQNTSSSVGSAFNAFGAKPGAFGFGQPAQQQPSSIFNTTPANATSTTGILGTTISPFSQPQQQQQQQNAFGGFGGKRGKH